MEYALAYSNTPAIISRFLLVNSFLVKRRPSHGLTKIGRFLELWSHLETAILKLLSRDEKLIGDFLQFQEELTIL
jgi:hypothetical protein